MSFFKLLKYDLKQGFLFNRLNLLVIVLFTISFCAEFYFKKNASYIFNESIPTGTFIDYLLYLLAGIKVYIPSLTDNFIFPVRWLLLLLLILYSTLYYPIRDLSSLGVSILVRAEGRITWWISKCIWNTCFVITTYILIFLTVLIFCFIMHEPISLGITPIFVNDLLDATSPYDTFPIQLAYFTLLLPMFFSIGFNLLQMTFVLFFKPLYSFGLIVVILLSSAYLFSPFMPGNYAMPIRSDHVIENGVPFSGGLIAFSILVSVSIITGSLYFRSYDILNINENNG